MTRLVLEFETMVELGERLRAVLTRTQIAQLVPQLAPHPGNPMHLLGDPASFDESEADAPSLMSERPVTMDMLIERSSLGTAEAKAARDQAPPEAVERVLARVKQLEQGSKMRSYRCASPRCPGYPWPASEVAHPLKTCGTGGVADGEPAPVQQLAPDVEPEPCGCEESVWLRRRLAVLELQQGIDHAQVEALRNQNEALSHELWSIREAAKLPPSSDEQSLVPLVQERVGRWLSETCDRLDQRREGPRLLDGAGLRLTLRYEGDEDGARFFRCTLTEEHEAEVEGSA